MNVEFKEIVEEEERRRLINRVRFSFPGPRKGGNENATKTLHHAPIQLRLIAACQYLDPLDCLSYETVAFADRVTPFAFVVMATLQKPLMVRAERRNLAARAKKNFKPRPWTQVWKAWC